MVPHSSHIWSFPFRHGGRPKSSKSWMTMMLTVVIGLIYQWQIAWPTDLRLVLDLFTGVMNHFTKWDPSRQGSQFCGHCFSGKVSWELLIQHEGSFAKTTSHDFEAIDFSMCSKLRQKLEIWAVRCVQQDLISAAETDLERLLNHKRRDCHRWCIFSNLTRQAGWLILFGMSCLSGVSISNMKMTGHHQSPATYGI